MTDPTEREPRHPGIESLLRYFESGHLPPHLVQVSEPFGRLAREVVHGLPDSAELTVGLRKLLEAKDCFVRAALDAHPGPTGIGFCGHQLVAGLRCDQAPGHAGMHINSRVVGAMW